MVLATRFTLHIFLYTDQFDLLILRHEGQFRFLSSWLPLCRVQNRYTGIDSDGRHQVVSLSKRAPSPITRPLELGTRLNELMNEGR